MKVFAYCASSFREGTKKAAGVQPKTCPPIDVADFQPEWLQDQDFLYFDLHGHPEWPFWTGDRMITAITAAQIRSVDLTGAIVFALSCYLADEGSPMLDALLDAGVKYVIGGDGLNYGSTRGNPYGAVLLGKVFRRLVGYGCGVPWALALAKAYIKPHLLAAPKNIRPATQDTLAFRAYYRGPGREA